jgi:hypothetical protein
MAFRTVLGLAGFALFAAACGSSSDDSSELVGHAEAAISEVPASVACIRITAIGSRTVERRYSVTAGQKSVFALTGMPLGNVTFVGDAFDVACSVVDATTRASWVSDPAVTVTLTPSSTPSFTLAMKRNGNATATVDFQDDDAGAGDGGSTCSGAGAPCTAGTAGICRRAGTMVCASTTTTTCSVTAGTIVDAYQSAISTDASIDTSTASSGYDPRWDYNCDGVITINASNMSGMVGNILATGAAYNLICASSFQAACQTLTQQQCKFGYLLAECGHSCGGGNCTAAQECGRPVTNEAQCAWQQTTSGCDYIGPGSAGATFVCK